ncbi:MAG: peptidylprolyl isomerase [Phycisphaerales bacterium]
MKTNTILVLALSFAMMLIIGCEEAAKAPAVDPKRLDSVIPPKEKPPLPDATGGFVISIDSNPITADEVYEEARPVISQLAKDPNDANFATNTVRYIRLVLNRKIYDIKLYERAKEALPEGVDDETIDKIVEEEVQKFIARCGGNYSEVEKLLAKMGTNWNEFYKEQRRTILIQSFVSEELKNDKPIIHSEMLAYYNKLIKTDPNYSQKGEVSARLIDIQKYSLYDVNDPNGDLDLKAEKLAAEICEKIKNGEDFNELAKKYSRDYSAYDGGIWTFTPGSVLKEPYDILAKNLDDMKPGQVSEPIKIKQHLFILKLEKHNPTINKTFLEMQHEIEARIWFERRKKIVDEMEEKMMEQIDFEYPRQFLKYCLYKASKEFRPSLIEG